MTKSALVLILLLVMQPVMAETYKWVDRKGTVNYTDDLSNVPEKYRSKVEIVGGNATATTEVIKEEGGEAMVAKEPETNESAAPPVSEKNEPAVAPAKEGVPAAEKEKKKVRYGDKDEDAWNSEFTGLNKELKFVEEQLKEKKGRLADPAKLIRAEYRGLEREVKNLESRQADLQAKLDALRDAAAKAGVPAGIGN
jgi:FtsZ-binding cell division protein ZapB